MTRYIGCKGVATECLTYGTRAPATDHGSQFTVRHGLTRLYIEQSQIHPTLKGSNVGGGEYTATDVRHSVCMLHL